MTRHSFVVYKFTTKLFNNRHSRHLPFFILTDSKRTRDFLAWIVYKTIIIFELGRLLHVLLIVEYTDHIVFTRNKIAENIKLSKVKLFFQGRWRWENQRRIFIEGMESNITITKSMDHSQQTLYGLLQRQYITKSDRIIPTQSI